MTDSPERAAWRAEFERFGEEQTRSALESGFFPEPKRQFAFRWLGEQALERRKRETATYDYVRRTYFAAVAAVIVGAAGAVLALIGIWATLRHG